MEIHEIKTAKDFMACIEAWGWDREEYRKFATFFLQQMINNGISQEEIEEAIGRDRFQALTLDWESE